MNGQAIALMLLASGVIGRLTRRPPRPLVLREPPSWGSCLATITRANEIKNRLLTIEDLLSSAAIGRAITAEDEYRQRRHTLADPERLLRIERERLRALLLDELDALMDMRVDGIRDRVRISADTQEGSDAA